MLREGAILRLAAILREVCWRALPHEWPSGRSTFAALGPVFNASLILRLGLASLDWAHWHREGFEQGPCSASTTAFK